MDASNRSSAQSECAIVINPANTNNVLAGANDFASPSMVAFWSTNSGAAWQTVVMPLVFANGHAYAVASDPTVAFDLRGNAYYAYLLYNTSGSEKNNNGIGVAKSTDGGRTWSNPTEVVEDIGHTVPSEDKEMMAIDTVAGSPFTNNIYVAWDRNEVGGTQTIRLSRSTDGGASFSAPVQVDDPATSSGNVIYATPAVGTNGEVYLVWNDYGSSVSTSGSIKVDRSVDAGVTWGTDRIVASGVVLNLFSSNAPIPAQPDRGIAASPSIAVDTSTGPHRGNVYVVWCDAASSSTTNVDIFFSRSTDRGQTWSPRQRVNDDATATSQFFPWVAVDPADGTIHISWYDCRDDSTNRKTHIYYTRSTNGGTSFEPNQRVTTVQSDESTANTSRNLNNYGDYAGIATLNGRAYPVWTDTRRFVDGLAEEIYTAPITPVSTAPPPTVSSVTPACGPLSGGTAVTVGGSNFQSGAALTIGGLVASNIVFVSSTALTATTSAGSAGAKTVVVTNPDTQAGALSNAFNYVAPPSFTGLGAVSPAVEAATLTWSTASDASAVTYHVFEGTSPGAENFGSPVATTAGLSVFLSPLVPGTTNPITYYFVVRATDACGNAESNGVEGSVQPLLDPAKDQDGDGLPNGWEQQYGLNPFDPSDAGTDSDGDGFTNLQEFMAGTDPTNSASYFHIISVVRTGNDIAVTWMTGPGRTNALQVGTGVAGSYATNFAVIFTVTNTVGTMTNYLDLGGATNKPSRYYRVRLVP